MEYIQKLKKNKLNLKNNLLSNINYIISDWFSEKGYSDKSNRALLDKILVNKTLLLKELLFFYTSSSIINPGGVTEEYFFELFFDFLNRETQLNKKEIDYISLAYINKGKEKFAVLVSSILSNNIKKVIGLNNLRKIEEKIENKEQSKIILSFLEKNPKYIESTVFLILGISDIKKVIELITKINNYNNIIKLTDDKFQFERKKDNTISNLNILDIHYTILLIENTIILNNLMLIINNINIKYLIKLLNLLGPYEVTNLINIVPNIIDFINYINSNKIDDIIENIKNKGIVNFVKSI